MSKFFQVLSRGLLASLLVVVWFAPGASAETVCEATDDGWDCTLLDISSTVIVLAYVFFDAAKLIAIFLVADCILMPF